MAPIEDRIYLSPPDIGEAELGLVHDAFESNWIAPLGPHVDAFESELAAEVGVAHAAALSSGTAGLHLALILLGVGSGDEVLVSDFTFAATANAVAYVGATPTFIDCDATTWNMDPDLVEEVLERRARHGRLPAAVVVVDLYGQCADYDRILPVCADYGVPVIEDAAEALGASYRGRAAGAFGDCAVFSFNGNKIITTSGGGMLVSDDAGLIDAARFLSTQARDPAPHYQHSKIGYNYRLSNVLAAIGRGQLRSLAAKVAARRRNFDHYAELLAGAPGLEFMPEAEYGESNRWLTCLTIDPGTFGAGREDVRIALEERNIESRPLWKPMHLQPVFEGCEFFGTGVAAGLFERGLCLPSGSALTAAQRSQIADIVLSRANA